MGNWVCLAVLGLGGPMGASDLGADTVAKLIRVVMQGTGSTSVACDDPEIASKLAKLGVTIDTAAKIVWTEKEQDIPGLARAGKFVICGSRKGTQTGAVMAMVNEGGHPAIMINKRALAATHLSLPDAILKLAKEAL